MGEDFPQDVPQEELSQTQIAENQDQPHGETIQDLGVTAIEQSEVHDNRVDDVDKAHDMALASDEERTGGAKHRRATELSYKTIDSLKAKDSLSPGEWRSHISELSDLPQAEPHIDDYTRIRNDVEHGAPTYTPGRHESQAKAHDRKAEQLEEWAGKLHDFPVSEAYKEAHSGIEFTAQSLSALEDLHIADVEEITKARKELNYLPLRAIFNPNSNSADYEKLVYGHASSNEASKMIREWRTLQSSDSTTIAEIRTAYSKVYEEFVLKPKEAKASLTGNLLADVASGKATGHTNEQDQ